MKDVNSQFPPIVIRRSIGWRPLKLAELWEYRELLYFLVWRDVKVRYKQTIIGAAWVIIQPSFLTLAFSIFFGQLVKVPSNGVPYPLFAFCGLLPWQLFAQALTNSCNSLVANERLLTKIYFPRLIIPLSAAFSGLVDFVCALLVLMTMMAYYGLVPTLALLILPVFVLMALATAIAFGLWLSALNVEYRDVRYTIPFIIQFWFFVTPVVYPSSLVPETWQLVYSINPMVGVVEGFRWTLLGKASVPGSSFAIANTIILLVIIGGLYYFRRMEKKFADVV